MKHIRLVILTVMLCVLNMAHGQKSLPREVADEFGKLLVYHNNRVCPLQTLARDFTIKLTGKTSYKDFSAEQIFTGYLFYYDDWKSQPTIKIKDKNVRQTLGIETEYACMDDFVSPSGYKLTGVSGKEFVAADEKYNLALMNATGSLLRIFPYRDQDSTVQWYAINDKLPYNMPQEHSLLIHKSMTLIGEYIKLDNKDEAIHLLQQIGVYQKLQLGSDAPSNVRIQAERIYNHFNYNRPFAILLMVLGIVSYILHNIKTSRFQNCIEWIIIGATAIYLIVSLTLRGIIANHFPVSNSFETMQFLALITTLFPFISKLLRQPTQTILPFSILFAGIALMVATMSELNPQITLLMPVLQSPLLSIHVMVIMISYVLFAFLAFSSIINLIKNKESQVPNILLLILALFLLTAGIFIGAIWANMSWGRYWGWDPKEVWALITMLIYSLPLHRASLPIFRNPRFMNWYFILAFLSVIITYFGVNFLLGGLHSYA